MEFLTHKYYYTITVLCDFEPKITSIQINVVFTTFINEEDTHDVVVKPQTTSLHTNRSTSELRPHWQPLIDIYLMSIWYS